jgi:molybdate transport system ATP-binding protein
MKLKIEDIHFSHGPEEFNYRAELTQQITGVFGYSGSGKTTLLNLVCGILTPSSGRLELNGKVYFDKALGINIPVQRRNFGVVFQENLLFPHLSVRKNLLYSRPSKAENHTGICFRELLELLDLGDLLRKKPHQLSGGECQRVAIGRSLLSQPELLLMDEPFANLDRSRRVEIICYLRQLTRELKIPLIIISHDLEDLLKLTNSLLVIQDGQIKDAGRFEDLAYTDDSNIFRMDTFGQTRAYDEGISDSKGKIVS